MRTKAIARASEALHKATLVDKLDLDACAIATLRAALDLTDEEKTKLACAIAQGSAGGWNAAARAALDVLIQKASSE